MTYTLSKHDNKIVFQRQSQGCLRAIFLGFGLAIILLGLIIPWDYYHPIQNILPILLGLFFLGAAFYVPKVIELNAPERLAFRTLEGQVQIHMSNQDSVSFPFSQIEKVSIQEEKRSPSAANSRGINYIHYHIEIKRKNGGTWSVTSTTNKEEANRILKNLMEEIDLNQSNTNHDVKTIPSKINIENGNPTVLNWKNNTLAIGTIEIVHTEEGKIQRCLVKNFSKVVYSYSGFMKNTNASCALYFLDADNKREMISLLIPMLNPVELLQFELWLSEKINEMKSNLNLG